MGLSDAMRGATMHTRSTLDGSRRYRAPEGMPGWRCVRRCWRACWPWPDSFGLPGRPSRRAPSRPNGCRSDLSTCKTLVDSLARGLRLPSSRRRPRSPEYAQLVQEQRRTGAQRGAGTAERAGGRSPARRRVGGSTGVSCSPTRRPRAVAVRSIDIRRLVVHTPMSKDPGTTVAFFDNRVLIAAEGASSAHRRWHAAGSLRQLANR